MAAGQLYTVFMSLLDAECARPGQFVHKDDDDPTISGFISDVNGQVLTVCLFDRREDIPDCATILADTLDREQVYNYLAQALEQNPDMKQHWMDLINEA